MWGVPIPFKPYQHPLGDLIGWREAAGHAVALRERLLPAGAGAIYVGNWALGSRIGWYAGEPCWIWRTRVGPAGVVACTCRALAGAATTT